MRRRSCLLSGSAWNSEAAAHSPTPIPGNAAASHTKSDKARDAQAAAPKTESLEAFIPSGIAPIQAVCARGSVFTSPGNKSPPQGWWCAQNSVWTIFWAPRDTATFLLTQRDDFFPAVAGKAFPGLWLAPVTAQSPLHTRAAPVPPHAQVCVHTEHQQLRERTGC